jgi:hypothetical protein
MRAMETLIPYAKIPCLCESEFSVLVTIKTKNRNRLDAQHDMLVDLSKTAQRFDVFIPAKPQESSHCYVFKKKIWL